MIPTGIILTPDDARRIERAIRQSERTKQMIPTRRRPRLQEASAAGISWIEAKVILQPSYEDNDDRDYYTLRLASDTTTDWTQGSYAQGESVIGSDTRKYTSLENGNTVNPVEDTQHVHWTLETEIQVNETYSGRNLAMDLRDYVPWFMAGQIIRLLKEDGVYYLFDEPGYVGAESVRSIAWLEQDGRMAAVVI